MTTLRGSLPVLGFIVAALAFALVTPYVDSPRLDAWLTVFLAIVLQATPFVVLGVVLAAGITEFVGEPLLKRLLPRHPMVAVPAAGLAGIALPGCECASVPIAASLIRNGASPSAALTFMLAGPAVNPVVLVATAIAFPGRPMVVLARFAASMITSLLIGWLYAARGVPVRPRPRRSDHGGSRVDGFVREASHDFVETSGFLVVGAALAATVNTLLPRHLLDQMGGHAVLGAVTMACFAFLVAMCSEADAFVAASLTSFSEMSRLVFLVVGPAMDVKLATMNAGFFGRRFALAFVPTVFVVAALVACAVGAVLL